MDDELWGGCSDDDDIVAVLDVNHQTKVILDPNCCGAGVILGGDTSFNE